MSEITVRALAEDEWSTYRSIRLAALQEDPAAFASTYDEESQHSETDWRASLQRAHRLLAERGGEAVGVVSVGPSADDPRADDVFGLWVTPKLRNTGVAWRLVEEAAKQATRDGRAQLYYWVSTQNGRAIGFATNFGFRPTSHRRTARVSSEEFGDQEIALVLPLDGDPGSAVANPDEPELVARPGPVGGSGDDQAVQAP